MAEERIDIVVSERGSRVVQRNIEDIGKGARKSSTELDFLKNALATLGSALAVRELVRMLDTFTNLQNRLRSTGLEAGNLSAVYRELLAVSNSTRSSLEGSVELYSRLAVSSKELGVSQRELIDFTKSLNQAIILSGASATEAQAGLIQLSQGMASGTLRGDELRSVLEQLPAVADVIAKKLGVTRGELRKMGEDGKITANTILDAFKDARGELDERFGKTVPTLSQSFQVLKNNFLDLLGEWDKSTGITSILSENLLWMANNLDTITKVAISAAAGLALVGGTSVAIGWATRAVLALTAAIAANPVGFFVVVLTSAVTALTLFRDEINLGVDKVTSLGDLFRAFGETAQAVFRDLKAAASNTFGPLADSMFEWVKSMDLSVVGVLRAVAGGVDKYIGMWKGAFKAVTLLYTSLPAVVRDLTVSALNAILEQVGKFINKAGELLSSLTEFAGLGKIAKVDLTFTNEDAGAAKNLGANIAAAFKEGYNSSHFASDFLERSITRAQEIGQARTAQTPTADLNGKGSPAPKIDPDALKALKKLRDHLEDLIGSYDRVWAAQQEYLKALDLLDQGEKAGLITAERKAQVIKLIADQLRDALDPLGAINRQIEEESSLLKMTADQREVERQLRVIDLDLRRQGVILGAEELSVLREKLALLQKETELTQVQDGVLRNITGAQRDFKMELEAINRLIAEGAITRDQANAYLVEQNSTMMEGTIEAQQAILTAHQQTYDQIDAMRQADLISEQTAQQLKARASADLYSKQMQGAQGFFGALATLSKSKNRELAAIGKAAAITQATIDGVLAVQKALASSPPPWNYAMAAAVGAATAANVAAIMAQTPGFAFGGDFTVGGTGGTDSQLVAFRATPGERVSVSTPTQDRAQNRQGGGPVAAGAAPGVRIVNVLDPSMVGDYLSSPEGEEVFINTLSRNSDRVRALMRS